MPASARIATLADVMTGSGTAVTAATAEPSVEEVIVVELNVVEAIVVTVEVTAAVVTLMTDPAEICSRIGEEAAAAAVVVVTAETEEIASDASASAVLHPHAARSLHPT